MPEDFTVNSFTDLIFQIWILFQKLCIMLTNEELWERTQKLYEKERNFQLQFRNIAQISMWLYTCVYLTWKYMLPKTNCILYLDHLLNGLEFLTFSFN